MINLLNNQLKKQIDLLDNIFFNTVLIKHITKCYWFKQRRLGVKRRECWFTAWQECHAPSLSRSPTSWRSWTCLSTMHSIWCGLARPTLHPTSTSWSSCTPSSGNSAASVLTLSGNHLDSCFKVENCPSNTQ